MSNIVKIPKARIGPLVGAKGETKKQLEKELKAKIDVSSDGVIEYHSEDPILELKLGYIIKAVGRGFSANDALILMDDEYTFEIISIEEFAGKNKNNIERLRGRLIGSDGSAKLKIEETTGTKISIYGKTVGILGKFDDVAQAMESVGRLLKGASHKTVLEYLERYASSKYNRRGE